MQTTTADPEFALPRISPDGRRLVYLAPADGRRQVWVRDIEAEHTDAVHVRAMERHFAEHLGGRRGPSATR